MIGFVVGIPRCNEPPEVFAATFAALITSTQHPDRVVIIDNGDTPLTQEPLDLCMTMIDRPGRNVGCAGAWNRIIAYAKDMPLIILNGDCAVAPDTFERLFEAPSPALVCAIGFSCFRIDHEIRKAVGPFDEEYYPVYWEDTDYRYRCKLAGIPIIEWPIEESDRPSFGRAKYTTGVTHGWRREDAGYQGWTGEKLDWFYKRWEANRDRYHAKWGGMVGEETFTTPFDGKG